MQTQTYRPGFPFQLKSFWTGEAAPEYIRVKVQANIDRIRGEMEQATTEAARNSCAVRIMRLSGTLQQVRA